MFLGVPPEVPPDGGSRGSGPSGVPYSLRISQLRTALGRPTYPSPLRASRA